MSPDNLQKAIDLSKEGQKDEARHLLRNIIKEDPGNELAWLWFADTMPTMIERLRALERGSKINPESQRIKQAAVKLQKTQAEAARIQTLSGSSEIHGAGTILSQTDSSRIEQLVPTSSRPAPDIKLPKVSGSMQWVILILGIAALFIAIFWIGSRVGSDSTSPEELLLTESEIRKTVPVIKFSISRGPNSSCDLEITQGEELVTSCANLELRNETEDDWLQISLVEFRHEDYALQYVDGINAYYRRTNLNSFTQTTETGSYWLYWGFPENSPFSYTYGLATFQNTAIAITRQSGADLSINKENADQVFELLKNQLGKAFQ